MKVTVTLDLTPREEKHLRGCCVQRMVQTAVRVGEDAEAGKVDANTRELGSTSWQDFHEYGSLIDKLWRTVQNQIWSDDYPNISKDKS